MTYQTPDYCFVPFVTPAPAPACHLAAAGAGAGMTKGARAGKTIKLDVSG